MPRILVIDDDAHVRGTIRAVLEGAGYEVAEAGDGGSGLAALTPGMFDLAVVDIYMPEVDGLQTIRAIRNLHVELPVIVISGGGTYQRLDYLKVAEDFGASAVLSKPFTNAQLLDQVARLLKAAEQRERLRRVME